MKKIFFLFFLFCMACTIKTVHKWEDPIKQGKLNLFMVSEVLSANQIRLKDGKVVQYLGLRTSKKIEQTCKSANQWLLRTGKIFLEFPDDKPDKQGIYFAYAYAPTPKGLCFINQELLEFGYCELDPEFSDPQYKEEFQRLQKEAQIKKKGIWLSP